MAGPEEGEVDEPNVPDERDVSDPLHEPDAQGAPSEPHHRKAGRRGSVAVGVVLAFAGVLFTANAHLARTTDVRAPQDLAGLVERETKRVDQLSAQVDALRVRVGVLTDQQNTTGPVADPEQQAQTEFAAGLVAAEGPGITVQLTDAVSSVGRPANARPDDLLVHQQDVQAVVDALWAGGGEAMSIQGQRVIATSAVRCVGNVLQLQGRTYSPPYVIKAIGDPSSLAQALADSPEIQVYLRYVSSVGLGWSVTREDSVSIQAGVDLELQYAHVPAGVEAIPGPANGEEPTPATPASTSTSTATVTESPTSAGPQTALPDSGLVSPSPSVSLAP